MTVRNVCLTLLALLAFACSNEITRTQLTFSIDASQALRASTDSLQVTLSTQSHGKQPPVSFPKGELRWPVDIVVLPLAGNGSKEAVTLEATALDASGGVLARRTWTESFKPEEATGISVSLDGSAVNPGPELDGSTSDADGGLQSPADSGDEPPAKNCETDRTIKCDDANRCNGKETCDPKSTSADVRGCVPSSSPVTCMQDMTCDSNTGECSSCTAKPDGDGDGANSIACGGLDCNDNDNGVAPGKPEKCNNRDDDCDGMRDGTKADADCAPSAPRGGTASCVSGMCVGACNDKTHQITNGVCVPVPATCPIANPCAPGACNAGTPTYTCTCPAGYRAGAGMTRCAPVGVPTRTIGFETTCDGKATPGLFLGETKTLAADLYAACGVNSITSGTLMAPVQLINPLLPVIDGITKSTAVEVTSGAANSQLTIGFTQPVTALGFDILDIDNLMGLSVTLRAGQAPAFAGVVMPPAPGTKHTRFEYLAPAVPVDLVVISYTPAPAAPLTPSDRLFIDELSYRVGGCGDKVMEGAETCDDGNLVQCDGCDNACGTSAVGCFGAGACYAGGAISADNCRTCDLTAKAPAGGDIPLSKSPTAPASCGK
jgi:cysteine-rich repeat protein